MLLVRDFLRDQKIMRGMSEGPAPLVSVILPTHSRRELLRRAVASVLSQTFADFELLVMNDGSTDGSFELIEDFRKHDPRVIHVHHERNSGLPGLRVNEGIELARGPYLAFQFDDDCWRPDALKALVSEADRHAEAVVVVGHSHFVGKTGEATAPAVELNLVNLYDQNRFANNSALFPRRLVEQYGLYDCHIGMRRLCDWDLWLRYIKHVPFIVVGDIISDVFESNPGSIGLTVPWDLPLFRYLHDIPRDHLLTLNRWRDYQVDALRVGEVEIEKDFRRRLYEEHLVPYYLKVRHYFPALEGFSATLPPEKKTVLFTKGSYDVSNDVTLNHYDALSNRRGNYKAHFEPLSQITPDWVNENDALLLVRTVEEDAETLVQQSLAAGPPVGLYLDDDLLTFHEFGPQFDYLAPGTPYFQNLSNLLKRVDAVWVTNRYIAESVGSLNPRVIPHNNAVPQGALPSEICPRDAAQPLRIGYVGSGYRLEEFKHIWEALLRVSREFGERLLFEFWGLDINSLPRLASPVIQRPFTFSYLHYLGQLRNAGFDLLLAPLLDHPRPRLAKSLIKYYETAAAGALGIFSDVPQYASLPAGLTCLKAENTVEAWYAALRQAITMPVGQFDLMRRRALEHVREEFTEAAQIHLHEAAWRATEFHAKTRRARHADGRPRVVYVLHSANFGGGEIQLWRRLRLARTYGIEPIVVLPRILQTTETALRISETLSKEQTQVEFIDYTCFTEPRSPGEFFSEPEREDVRALLQRCAPALVHTVTFIPSFGQVCQEMGIPHVASLYAVEDDFTWLEGWPNFTHSAMVQSDSIRYATRWGNLLEVEKMCSRELVPEPVFALGQTRYLESLGTPPTQPHGRVRLAVNGTLQERKRQLETIEAIGRLVREGWDCQLDVYGYTHFFPEYVDKCKQRIRSLNLSDCVTFRGFSEDVAALLKSADLLLSLSTYESFPSAIKEAMAGGVLVVATPVGGIPELIMDGVSGILCADTSVEAMTDGIRRALTLTPADRQRIVEQARRVARSEFHPQRIASDLLLMYNRAIDLTRAAVPAASAPDGRGRSVTPTAKRGRMVEPKRPPASVVPLDRQLTYRVVPHHANWMGIDVLVGTHQRRATGTVILRLFSSTRRLLCETSIDLARAHDNDWLRFRFDPLADVAEQPVLLRFMLANADPKTLISFYDTRPPEKKFQRIVHRLLRRAGIQALGNSLYCRLWYAA